MLRRLTGALLVSAGLAACGSSAGTQTGTPIPTSATSSHAGAAIGPVSTTRRAPRRPHRPHEVPRNRMPRHSHGGGSDITGGFTIRAEMTIGAGERLTPPVIALPTFNATTLDLTFRASDHHAHTVLLANHRLRVPAGGHVEVTIHHLAHGSHAVTVDGHSGGKLTVGSAGGP
jgi:hypothetical protein